MHRWVVPLAAAVLLAACSGAQNGQNAQTASSAAAPLHNPVDFPLYPGAALLSTHQFTQVIKADTSAGGSSIFQNGNGTYSGNEVIASTAASFDELSAWVDRLNGSPPAGYAAVETGGDPNQRAQARRIGIAYALFKKPEAGRTRGLLLLAMDPTLVNQRFGSVLRLIGKYRALPAIMRDPIDNEVKARIGMTISQATAPESPVGAALSALDQFEHKNSRGIVVLDASKR